MTREVKQIAGETNWRRSSSPCIKGGEFRHSIRTTGNLMKRHRTKICMNKKYKVVGDSMTEHKKRNDLKFVGKDHNRRKTKGGTTGRIHTVLKQRHFKAPVFSCLHAASRVTVTGYVSGKINPRKNKTKKKTTRILSVYPRDINRELTNLFCFFPTYSSSVELF